MKLLVILYLILILPELQIKSYESFFNMISINLKDLKII
jgi:hypothetical protein